MINISSIGEGEARLSVIVIIIDDEVIKISLQQKHLTNAVDCS
jgi:hypothetical protein